MSKSRYLSKTQLADITGLDRDTVTKKLESLQPYSAKSNLIQYDTRLALPLLYARDSNVGLERKIEEEKLRYDTARADKMELEVKKRRDQLVEIETVGQDVDKEYAAVRSALLAIPSKLALDLATITEPAVIKKELEDSINEALSELSNPIEGISDEPTEETSEESSEDASSETET